MLSTLILTGSGITPAGGGGGPIRINNVVKLSLINSPNPKQFLLYKTKAPGASGSHRARFPVDRLIPNDLDVEHLYPVIGTLNGLVRIDRTSVSCSESPANGILAADIEVAPLSTTSFATSVRFLCSSCHSCFGADVKSLIRLAC